MRMAGSITERHLLFALSQKILEKAGGDSCAEFVEQKLGIALNETARERLSDPGNPHRIYDLLGVMKAELVGRIYVPATDECLPFRELVKLADEVGSDPVLSLSGRCDEFRHRRQEGGQVRG